MNDKLSDFDYHLPKELIAQRPHDKRGESRLLVVDRKSDALTDDLFCHLPRYLRDEDLLVLNDTKVLKARLTGQKEKTGGKVDVLLLNSSDGIGWQALVKPSNLKEGQKILFGENKGAVYLGWLKSGISKIQFEGEAADVSSFIEKSGRMPLPPYIKRLPDLADEERYQTVYASKKGAVAAPTAGLHFTQTLLDEIRSNRTGVAAVTLHVGLGTFQPIKEIQGHEMHSEEFQLPPDAAIQINETRKKGGRIVAVGTTTARVLEACAAQEKVTARKGCTDLFIRPPYRFQMVDALITNFHLPKTTLMMLVSAFAGRVELIQQAYRHAIGKKYKFYSYGDAMLII